MVRFRFAWHRARGLHTSWRIFAAAAALAVWADGPEAVAQTGYSLRMRALGTPFAGIIDDPFTDAFLNPARVGDLGGRQVYVGQLPSPGVSVIFPEIAYRYSLEGVFPPERQLTSNPSYVSGYAPYTAGVVSPLGRKLTSSFAVEAAADGTDQLDDEGAVDVDVLPTLDVSSARYVRGSERSYYHAVIDGAVGTGTPQTSGGRYGVRATVGYEEHTDASASDRVEVDVPGSDVREQRYEDDYYHDRACYEEASLSVALGRFSRESFVREIVWGGSLHRRQLDIANLYVHIYDYDYDGNGRDPWGYDPRYSYGRGDFGSKRDYNGWAVFGRLGLEWRQGLRSYHELSWRRLTGDGDGAFMRDAIVSDNTTETSGLECRYGEEGDITAVRCVNSIGYLDEVRDGLLWAVAAQARFIRDTYDETGAGTLEAVMHDSSDSTMIDAPYRQELRYELESWVFQLPVAIEWEIHRHLAWRFGIVFEAQRNERETTVGQSVETLVPYLDQFASSFDRTHSLEYETAVLFNSGIAANLWDRINIDLFGGSHSGWADLLYYVNALVTYRF